ncbi:hypothetical protein [Corallococcus terminator]|uniref:Uncharacterized protein n=1 Tax=Corallococcus terminator TaxID=2316733 RepID=A0A3A8I3F4_9BACT|nr:hypothetical protein [Corallococcus terminator]RKG74264.1 hypothetical protein D7V88_35145 [Corallococcus terminator]
MTRHRIHTGTDIACVGIWDAGLPPSKRSIEGKALEASAARGELLPIYTHADGSYILQIHVDEPFVPPPSQQFETLGREFGLHLGSGTAIAGGCEDFRSPRPQITSVEDQFHVEPSWYRVRVHLNQMDGPEHEERAHQEARQTLTPEEFARYTRLGKSRRVGCLLAGVAVSAVMAAVFFRNGLALGALVTLMAGAMGWMFLRFKRDGYAALHLRYQRALDAAVPPDIVLELYRAEGPLPGGSVALEGQPFS